MSSLFILISLQSSLYQILIKFVCYDRLSWEIMMAFSDRVEFVFGLKEILQDLQRSFKRYTVSNKVFEFHPCLCSLVLNIRDNKY